MGCESNTDTDYCNVIAGLIAPTYLSNTFDDSNENACYKWNFVSKWNWHSDTRLLFLFNACFYYQIESYIWILATNIYVSHHCKFLILIMREKKLKIGKNLLVLCKSLLVTIAGTWDSLRFSVIPKVFHASKFWLILSKNFLHLGMKFVYEKMTTYKIASSRKSIFSMRIFSTSKQSYNKHYIHFFISIR